MRFERTRPHNNKIVNCNIYVEIHVENAIAHFRATSKVSTQYTDCSWMQFNGDINTGSMCVFQLN